MTRRFAPVLAGLAVAMAAFLCRAPGVVYADAGELLTAVALKGVAHPPGFPLYLLLGGLWCDAARLAGAPLASALNAFSSVCAGVAAGGATAAANALMDRLGLAPDRIDRGLLALAGGLLTGFGLTLFDFAQTIEVYALHMAFVAPAVALASRPGARRTPGEPGGSPSAPASQRAGPWLSTTPR